MILGVLNRNQRLVATEVCFPNHQAICSLGEICIDDPHEFGEQPPCTLDISWGLPTISKCTFDI
jgi:hypothetical protein